MKLQAVAPPDRGSLSVVYACPECGYEMAMLTNAYETQVAGRTAYVSEDKESVVVFNNDWNSFIISGGAPVGDLLAMAESILQ
jgi:hypothetical protein